MQNKTKKCTKNKKQQKNKYLKKKNANVTFMPPYKIEFSFGL
jgi:hypothetical protein